MSAQDALGTYLTAYGPFRCAVAGAAAVFDFSPHPYEDDAVAEFSRSLTTAGVVAVRFLAGISAGDIAALSDTLHLLQPTLKRAGSVGTMLRERGVQTVAVEDLVQAAVSGPSARTDVLVEALQAGPEHLAARLQEASRGSVPEAARLLQELDRVIAAWPQPDQDPAWRSVAAAVMASTPPLQPQLCREILRALREPWAASLAGRWRPALVAGIISAEPGHAGAGTEDVTAPVRALHQGPVQVRVPAAEGVDPSMRERSARLLAAMDEITLKRDAMARFLDALPLLGATQFDQGVRLIERELVEAVRAEDIESVVGVLTGLAVFARQLQMRAPSSPGRRCTGCCPRLSATWSRGLCRKLLTNVIRCGRRWRPLPQKPSPCSWSYWPTKTACMCGGGSSPCWQRWHGSTSHCWQNISPIHAGLSPATWSPPWARCAIPRSFPTSRLPCSTTISAFARRRSRRSPGWGRPRPWQLWPRRCATRMRRPGRLLQQEHGIHQPSSRVSPTSSRSPERQTHESTECHPPKRAQQLAGLEQQPAGTLGTATIGSLPVQMRVRGTYPQVRVLVQSLEDSARFVELDRIALTGTDSGIVADVALRALFIR